MKKESEYKRVYRILRNEIRDGEYLVGQFLPPEPVLEEKFNVSRTTVRKAVELLVSEGYVYVKQGRGTEVLGFSASQDLNIVNSVSETLRKKGYKVYTKRYYIDEIPASDSIARDLELPDGSSTVLRIQRLLIAEDEPIAIMKNYIYTQLAPGFIERAKNIDSLYKFLETEYNIIIDRAINTIFARGADFAESEMLNIENGSPLICIRRVTYCDDTPVTVDKTAIRHEKYEFTVNVKGKPFFRSMA